MNNMIKIVQGTISNKNKKQPPWQLKYSKIDHGTLVMKNSCFARWPGHDVMYYIMH